MYCGDRRANDERMTDILVHPSTAKQRYDADGVVQVKGLLSPDEVAHIRDVFTAKVESDVAFGWDDNLPEDDILARYPRFVHPHRHPDVEAGRLAQQYMFDPRIFTVVEDLIGPAWGAQSMFYFKPPTARGQALHQDNAFLRADPETCLAAWIAIDDCDGENGGLMVVPGSHRVQILCLEPADQDESFSTAQVPVPEGVEIHQTEMKAGDVLFFHGSMVHGSKANTSTDRFRRSLIFHYVPQASEEIALFYDPLIAPNGDEVHIKDSGDGGPCGEGWGPAGPH